MIHEMFSSAKMYLPTYFSIRIPLSPLLLKNVAVLQGREVTQQH